jgi:hypothetical protein
MFVLFTGTVNNRVVPELDKHHEYRTVRNATAFGYCLLSTVECVMITFGLMQETIFFGNVSVNTVFIGWWVQNIFRGNMNF